MIWLYFNFIFFICYMLSFEIIEWFTIILLHSMTWIIWCLELYIFLLNIFLLILFYIILLFVSYSLPKKVIDLSLSLSQLLILSCNCKFRLTNFFLCPYFWMIHFGGMFFELFITYTLYLIVLVWVNF